MSRNEHFDTGSLTRLDISLAWATLELTSDAVDSLQLIVAGTPEDEEDLRISSESGVLRVEQPAYGLSTRINTERWLQVSVRIPRDWKGELSAGTISGLLRARGLSGSDFGFSTVTGALRVRELTAMTLALRTVSGTLSAGTLKADTLSLRTVSGDVTVENARVQRLKATVVSGDMNLELTEPPQRVDISGISGDIGLTVPTDRASISLRAVSGKLRTAGVETADEGPVISATTVAGNLTVTRRVPDAAKAEE